jgi:peptidoglycan/LPS O-acetylase OafA/YrhL
MVAFSIWWHLDLADVVGDYAAGAPRTWLPAFLTWFAVGIALAWAHVHHQDRRRPGTAVKWLAAVGAMPGVCWSAVAGLMLVAATPLAGPSLLFVATPAESLTKHLLYALVGGLVVITGIFSEPHGRYTEIMSIRPLRHLGHISYSTFCIHLPVLHLIMSITGYALFAGHGLEIWVLTVVASLLASELLYRLVERPFMRLKDAGRRRSPAAGSASNATHTTTTK